MYRHPMFAFAHIHGIKTINNSADHSPTASPAEVAYTAEFLLVQESGLVWRGQHEYSQNITCDPSLPLPFHPQSKFLLWSP